MYPVSDAPHSAQHGEFAHICESLTGVEYEKQWGEGDEPFSVLMTRCVSPLQLLSTKLPNGSLAIIRSDHNGYWAAVYETERGNGLFKVAAHKHYQQRLYRDYAIFQESLVDIDVAKLFVNNESEVWLTEDEISYRRRLGINPPEWEQLVLSNLVQYGRNYQTWISNLSNNTRRDNKQQILNIISLMFNLLNCDGRNNIKCLVDPSRKTREGIRTALVFARKAIDFNEKESWREVMVIPVDLKNFTLREMEFDPDFVPMLERDPFAFNSVRLAEITDITSRVQISGDDDG